MEITFKATVSIFRARLVFYDSLNESLKQFHNGKGMSQTEKYYITDRIYTACAAIEAFDRLLGIDSNFSPTPKIMRKNGLVYSQENILRVYKDLRE